MLKVLLSLALFISFAHAKNLPADAVVRTMIESVHKNDLSWFMKVCDIGKVSSCPRHGMSQEDLLTFLLDIDPSKVKFEPYKYEDEYKILVIHMIEPINMDFELEPRGHNNKRIPLHYVVVGVHP